jgi:hypothetical protein
MCRHLAETRDSLWFGVEAIWREDYSRMWLLVKAAQHVGRRSPFFVLFYLSLIYFFVRIYIIILFFKLSVCVSLQQKNKKK